MRKMICIVCPIGCHLTITDDEKISGNRCRRGIDYAITELHYPTRTLTTTVRTTNPDQPRLSVKSKQPIPKAKLLDAMKVINQVVLDAPVKIGDVIIDNICQTDIAIIATQDSRKKPSEVR